MNDRLHPEIVRKALLWASFVAFGTSAFAAFVSDFPSFWGMFCLLPWLVHRGFLPKGMPILGEEGRRNFKPATIILASLICTLNCFGVLLALGEMFLDHISLDVEEYFGPLFLFIGLISILFVWIYVLNWFDSLTQITYYRALSRAMLAMAGPPLIGIALVLFHYSLTGSFFNSELGIFRGENFKSMVVFWCGSILIWSLIPWLYVLILNKTYRQALRESEESESLDEDVVPPEQMEGLPDWFEPLPKR
jgi:hypothetical protein